MKKIKTFRLTGSVDGEKNAKNNISSTLIRIGSDNELASQMINKKRSFLSVFLLYFIYSEWSIANY